MALHQPFFEVIPVARELISKTKRIASKSVQQSTDTVTPRRHKPTKTSERPVPKVRGDSGQSKILPSPFTDEPEAMSPRERPKIPPQINGGGSPTNSNTPNRDRAKVTSMFRRTTTSPARSMGSGDKVSALPVLFAQALTLDTEHCIVDIISAQRRQQHQSHNPFE